MSNTVIKIENLSKRYRLGLVGSGTLKDDMKGWWYRARGKEDPTLQIGEENRLDKQSGNYVWALKDINLEVAQGEVLGIIGKNGAGKSTLLKILSRVTGPSTGTISTKGRIASLLEVGTGMHPELTGRENVFLNGAILGMSRQEIKSKFDEIVDFAGTVRYIDTPVKRYSSGMRVRLGFAVAAFLEPEILIVDEVLAVGDAEFQKKAIGKMQDVAKGEGRTVLFVSHNMGSVESLCNRGIVLSNGKVVYKGTQSEAVEHYLANVVKKDEAQNTEVDKGEISVFAVKIFDTSGKEIGFVKNGQDIEFHIYYNINGPIDHLNNIHVSLRLLNENGVCVFTHSNRLVERKYNAEEIKKREAFVIKIRNLPLPRGNYSVDTIIVHAYTKIDEKISIRDIDVIDGSFGSNIINPHPVHGVCLIDAEWDAH